MRIITTNMRDIKGRRGRILGATLMVALIMSSIAMSQSPATVNLRTAGDFVILSKTGISTTGVTRITGQMGVSPIAATAITGFGLIMDPSGTFSRSASVVGNIYAADYTSPTPSKMTTAIGDMETAYTDAAGRTLPNFTELYAGDVTGQTLTPGLYKWTTGVLVSAGGVTISGTASDVWIFQIAGNLELANGAMVTLGGSAQASRIFWQVGGQATLGTTAAMKGIILSQTAIVISTSATLNGRALAQTAVTLDANTITEPAGVTGVGNSVVTQEFALSQNYPNPFNPSTMIRFQIPQQGRVSLKVFDVLGREVATLVNEEKSAGSFAVRWDATTAGSGTYFARLESNGKSQMTKMLLMK